MTKEDNQNGAKAAGKSRQAWAEFGDTFGDIGRQFHQDYERVTETASQGTDESQKSIERAVKAIRTAIEATAKTIGASLQDPKVKQETAQAGSALMHAVGVSLSEVGEKLQRDADHEHQPASS